MSQRVPMRRCIACRVSYEKSSLMRIVKAESKTPVIDYKMRMNSRGMYLCKNAECIRLARKKGLLSRMMQCEIPESIYTEMEEYADGKT